jgi:hypothetical protein
MTRTTVAGILLCLTVGAPLRAQQRPAEHVSPIRDAVAQLAQPADAPANGNQRQRIPRRPPIRRGRDPIWNGALLGAIGGAAMGAFACRGVPQCPTFKMAAYIGTIGAVAGAAVDAKH